MNIEQAKALRYPLQVMIQTTSVCNSACVICPYPKLAKKNSSGVMGNTMFESLIDEIAGYPKIDRLMPYLMNEPLCDPKIAERIAYARKKLPDTEIYILTNGINLKGDLADRILDAGLSWIGLSVHAIEPETYQAITGRKDFKKIRDRLVKFARKAHDANGSDFVQVNVTRVRPHVSEQEFEKAAAFWKETGISRVDLDNGYISRAGNVDVFGHDLVHRKRISGCDTLWAYKMAHVLFDGTVLPCCMDWARKEPFGNIGQKSLLDIWRGEKRSVFLEKLGSGEQLPKDFLCVHCEDAITASTKVKEFSPEEQTEESSGTNPDILLVNPPPWLPYSPPLGLASIIAYLKERGFEADLLDANIELFDRSPESVRKLWEWEEGPLWEKPAEVERIFGEDLDEFARLIAQHPAEVIGISIASRKEYALSFIVKTLVELAPDKFLLFGGPGVSERTDRDRIHELIGPMVASTGRDILYGFVIGEGESALVEALQKLRSTESIESVDGIAIYREGGQAHYQPRKVIADLSDLPFPDFSKFPLDKYTHPSLTVEWSRGCIGQCVFCNIRDLWGRYRNKPAKKVIEEITHLVTTYNKTWFSICDPVINGRPDVLEEICDGINEAQLDINWAAGISPNREVSAEQFEKMKKAGCYRLEFGVESASDRVLAAMKKRYDAKTAGRMIEACKAAGIEVVLYLIVGFPEETEEEFEQTLSFLKDHAGSIDLVRSVNGLILVSGSPVEKSPGDFGIDEPDRQTTGWVSRWTAGKNNPELRVDRIERVLALLEEKGVPVEFSNREELLDGQKLYAGRIDHIEERLDDFEKRMSDFLQLQDKVLRGEPIRKNPFADQIALVLCPVWGTQMPPLGLAYLSAFLENQNWHPELIDFNIELFHGSTDQQKALFAEENFRHWTDPESFSRIRTAFSQAIDDLVDRLIRTEKRVIGFSVYSPNRLFTIEVCRRLKTRAPDRVIIVGGRGVFSENERLLFPPESIDYFVVGDGETTLVPLLEAVFDERDGAELPGVVRFEGYHLTPLVPRPIYEDLTIFPHPTWNGLNLDLYTDEELPLLFSRGCTGHCTFCNDHKAMGKYRVRPAEHQAAEVFWLARNLNRRKFKMNDQLINGDLEQLEGFCELVIEQGEQIEWIALAQPRGDMSDELVRKMKAAGCFTLNLGIESGSDKVLKRMGKGFSVEDIEKSIQQIFSAGINTMVNFIVGFPGETEENFRETMEFVRRNRQWICGVTSVNTCIVLEGSSLEIGAKTFGIQFPDQDKDIGWWSGDNTPQLRNDRAKRLVALLRELDVPFLVSNLREQVADLDDIGLPEAAKEAELQLVPVESEIESVDEVDEPMRHPQDHDYDPERGKPYFEKIDDSDSDILLLMLPSWGVEVAPLGLAYLASTVEAAGFNATVLDLNIKLYNRSEERTLWRMESYKYWTDPHLAPVTFEKFRDLIDHYLEQIADHPAKVLGFSALTGNFPFTRYLAERIRIAAPNKKIVFGGPGITNSFDIANLTSAHGDYLVLGDGEHALVALLEAIKKGEEPKTDGLIKIGDPIDFEDLPKALVKNLDDIPYPTFSQFNLKEYITDAIPIMLSRGCIRRCAFCNDHHIGQKYRYRDPQSVMDEIKYHVKTYGADRFSFLDVLINGRIDQLNRICDLIIDSGLQIRWGGQGVIRKEMSGDLLRKMKAAGCMSMVYGIESFSDTVLKQMNKPYTQVLAREILSRTKDAGIETIINVIVGFPGETDIEFNKTYDFICNNQEIIDQVASISPCLVNLGSRLFEKYSDYGIRFPETEGSIKWYSEDGNTFEVREKRVLELTTLLAERHKSVHTINLYDKAREDLASVEHETPCETCLQTEPEDGQAPCEEEPKKKQLTDKPVDAFLLLLPPWGIEFPPIGIASLATYARHSGFNVIADDLNVRWYDAGGEDYQNYWLPEHLKFWMPGNKLDRLVAFLNPHIENLLDHIEQSHPSFVGFSTNESNLILSEMVALRIKKRIPEIPVVFGGPGVSWPLDRKPISTDAVDGFVIGEGEETFVDILGRIKAGEELTGDIPGFELLGTGHEKDFIPRDLIRPLEKIPAPEFFEFPLHLYTQRDIPVLFSRGCINRCAFCNDYRITPKFRIKKPETLFEEIKKYKDELAGFEFAFNDLLVNADVEALCRFCDLVIDADLRLAWTGQAVVTKKMNDAVMQKLAKAGCVSLVFGAESFSPAVLEKMRKRFAPDEAKSVFQSAKKAGIEVIVNIIVGFPGEGEMEFQQTLDFIGENQNLIDRISALSSCIVVAQCDIERRPDHYDVVLPKPEHWRQWYSKDKTNTYETRLERVNRALDFFEKLGISHNMTNRYIEALEDKC